MNKLKSTTIYGTLQNSDMSGNNANAIFSRNLSVGGKITTSGLNSSSYITSQNLATPSTSLIPSTHGTFYSNGGSPFFSFNTGSVINSFVLATTSDLFSYLKITDAATTYLSKTDAISTYLKISDAVATYQPITSMSNYLTISSAADVYLTQTNAASIYQPISGMSNYLTTSSASSTYLSISSAASTYLTSSTAANTYIQKGGDIPFNTNIAKLSFLSSFPTTYVNNQNTGLGFYWNQSGGQGETDLVCYGQGGTGGLSIYGAGNSYAPTLISKLYSGYIEFFSTPVFPTSTSVGNIGATTQYVNDKLSQYQPTANMSNYANKSSNNIFTGTQEFNNNIYLNNSSLIFNGQTITNDLMNYSNFTFTLIGTNIFYS